MARARGPTLTPEVKALITSLHRRNPRWKAPRIRYETEERLRENPKKYGSLGRGYPSLSAVQKLLATIRRNEQIGSPLDEPWTLDSLKDCPISPQALGTVFWSWITWQIEPDMPALTVRQAKWIAQLSSMADDMSDLWSVAQACAELELLGEIAETPTLSSPAIMFRFYSRLNNRMDRKLVDELALLIEEEKPDFSPVKKRVLEELGRVLGSPLAGSATPEAVRQAIRRAGRSTKPGEREEANDEE